MSSAQSGSEKTNYADVVKAGLPQASCTSLPTTALSSPPSSVMANKFASTNSNVPVTTVPLSALTAESVPSTAMIMSSAPSKFFSNDSTYFNVNVNTILNNMNTCGDNIIKSNISIVNNNNSNNNNNNCEPKSSVNNNDCKSDNVVNGNKSGSIKTVVNTNERKIEHEQEELKQQHIEQKQIELNKESENSHKHSTATLPAMAANAKPYIPSYLAAAKRAVEAVKLDPVPVNVNEQVKTTDAWCSSTVSTSLMDPESTSSWADDDESFLQTVARQQDAMRVKMVNECQKGSGGNNNNAKNVYSNNDSERQPVRRDNANSIAVNNNSNNNNRFSFEFINDDEEEFNSSTNSRRNRERFAQVHNRVNRRGNWKNRNHSNQAQQQTQWRNKSSNNGNNKQQDSNNIISGGRFDVLANPRVMRYLESINQHIKKQN